MMGKHISTYVKTDPQLEGDASQGKILLNGVQAVALCDTGFCLSSCSET